MTPLRRKFTVGVVVATMAVGGCASAPRCDRVGGAPMLEYQLFFGSDRVSDQDWTDFTAQVVTPNLPDGFTAFDGQGQWMNPTTRRIVRERSKVILVVAPDTPATSAAIARIKDEYRARFSQITVGVLIHPVCGAF